MNVRDVMTTEPARRTPDINLGATVEINGGSKVLVLSAGITQTYECPKPVMGWFAAGTLH
jgi:hypothetical protein